MLSCVAVTTEELEVIKGQGDGRVIDVVGSDVDLVVYDHSGPIDTTAQAGLA